MSGRIPPTSSPDGEPRTPPGALLGSVRRDLVAGHVVLRLLGVVLPARAPGAGGARLVERAAGRGAGLPGASRLVLAGLAGRAGSVGVRGGVGRPGRFQGHGGDND